MTITNDWWPKFSHDEYAGRYARLREAMEERSLDALLVYGTSIYFGSDPGGPNVVYLAGYAPACQGYVILPREGDPTLLVYVPGHLENARQQSVISDVRAGNAIAELAVERMRELDYDIGAIGIVGNFDWAKISIPVEHYQFFAEQLPDTKLEVVTRWYEDLRLPKSAEEMAFMEAGAAITDRAHEKLRESTTPGVTDIALHLEVPRGVHEAGGRIPFGHVGSTPMLDPSMSYASFYPVNRVIQRGDAVLTELAAGYGGYFGKLWGTLIVGRPTPAYRTMFELAAEIYHDIYSFVKPGMRAGEVDSVLDGSTEGSGFRSLSCITGWSTYNTPPARNRTPGTDSDMELVPGLCINVFAWVVSPDERMGVWVGDTAAVSDDGLRPLHRYPVADLDYATLFPS